MCSWNPFPGHGPRRTGALSAPGFRGGAALLPDRSLLEKLVAHPPRFVTRAILYVAGIRADRTALGKDGEDGQPAQDRAPRRGEHEKPGEPRRGAPRECGRPQAGGHAVGAAGAGADRRGRGAGRILFPPGLAGPPVAGHIWRGGDPQASGVEPGAGVSPRPLAWSDPSAGRLAPADGMDGISSPCRRAIGPTPRPCCRKASSTSRTRPPAWRWNFSIRARAKRFSTFAPRRAARAC